MTNSAIDSIPLNIFNEYQEKLNKEKELFKKYVHIDTGKLPSENFNGNIISFLSDTTEENGLFLKWMNMLCQLDETNNNIISACKLWELIKDDHPKKYVFNTSIFFKIQALNSYIIHDIKRSIDDIISTIDFLKNNCKCIKVDCIGRNFYDNKRPCLSKIGHFDEQRDFLIKVNDLENAYKHSFTNNFSNLYGKDEPCIFAVYSKNNLNFKNAKIIGITLKELTEEYNTFYNKAKCIVEALCNEVHKNDQL